MNESSLQRDPVEVLAEEFLQRRRRGESVSVEEYAQQHPQLADRIREVFSTALWLEEFRQAGATLERPLQPTAEQSAPPDSPPPPLKRLGDFRIIREIGRGGMGVVYEAEQESLGRRVAVKVLPSIHLSSPSAVRRFRREAKAAARLHHTNIIPIFGVGEQDGVHYYVMQYIRGLSLDEVLEELSRRYLGSHPSASTLSAENFSANAASAQSALPPSEVAHDEIAVETRAAREEVWQLAQLLLTGGFAGSPGLAAAKRATDSSGSLPIVQAVPASGFSASTPPESGPQPSSPLGDGSWEAGVPKGSSPGSETHSGPTEVSDSSASLARWFRLGRGYWRSVAGVGLQAANALHYAHQQGALHRDIKPGNLILDREGRVWVADFGLAKLLDQEELTRSGDVVGTLRYMAPEQWEGQADARTDVYGLGLTLYEMLTLRPAFDETDRARLIRQVMEEEPTPPSKLQPSVPRDLETIVLKAIARQPADRYQTAAQLAEDLERFLEDRPVRARRASALERLWRWCRRNKLVAALSAAVVGLLAVVAVVASVGYVRTSAALRQESYERAQAETARKLADAERNRAEQERQKAEAEYARAEANLRLAIQAFEDIFHRIVAEPVFQPGPPAREESEGEEEGVEEPWEVYGWTSALTEKDAAVVQTMLAFYERFAQQNADNRTLQRETGQAYRRMGEIYLRLGNYEEAEKALLKARTTYARIALDAKPQGPLVVEQAMVENRLGNVYWFTGRGPQAFQCHQTARQILSQAPPEVAQTPACRLELARTYSALGRALSRRWMGPRGGRKPAPSGAVAGASSPTPPVQEETLDGAACYRQAVQLLQQLVEQSPQHPEYRLTLARTYRELAFFAGRRLPPDQIAAALQKSLELVEKLAADFPANPDYRFELAETYAAIARGGGRSSASPEDRRQLQEALRIETELVKQYPHVPDYQAALARLLSELARLAAASGQWTEAEQYLRQAVTIQQALVDRFPDLLPYQRALGQQWIFLSRVLQSQGKKEEYRKLLEEAIQRAEKMLQHPDRAMHARGFLSWAYAAHAELLQQLGQVEQAHQARQKAEQFRPKDAPGVRTPWLPGGPWWLPRPRPHEPPPPKEPPRSKDAPFSVKLMPEGKPQMAEGGGQQEVSLAR